MLYDNENILILNVQIEQLYERLMICIASKQICFNFKRITYCYQMVSQTFAAEKKNKNNILDRIIFIFPKTLRIL